MWYLDYNSFSHSFNFVRGWKNDRNTRVLSFPLFLADSKVYTLWNNLTRQFILKTFSLAIYTSEFYNDSDDALQIFPFSNRRKTKNQIAETRSSYQDWPGRLPEMTAAWILDVTVFICGKCHVKRNLRPIVSRDRSRQTGDSIRHCSNVHKCEGIKQL